MRDEISDGDISGEGEYRGVEHTAETEVDSLNGAIFYAIHDTIQPIITLLDKGINVNRQDTGGNTALHRLIYATTDGDYIHYTNSTDILEILLEGGADLSLKNNKGETFWDIINKLKMDPLPDTDTDTDTDSTPEYARIDDTDDCQLHYVVTDFERIAEEFPTKKSLRENNIKKHAKVASNIAKAANNIRGRPDFEKEIISLIFDYDDSAPSRSCRSPKKKYFREKDRGSILCKTKEIITQFKATEEKKCLPKISKIAPKST